MPKEIVHNHVPGIPDDSLYVDDEGNVTYRIAGHPVAREDFIAYQLMQIKASLEDRAYFSERYTVPENLS